MKIAIPCSSPGLEGVVANKLGTAAHLVVVDSEDMSVEAVDGPPRASGAGAGVMVMSLVVNLGADVILVGHVAPHITNALQKQGIEVVTNVSGSAHQAVTEFLEKRLQEEGVSAIPDTEAPAPSREWKEAARKGGRQFYALVPRLTGVILLLGLFRGFVSEEMLLSMFSGVPALDALWGASLGSILAGNPVNSYVIGDSLLKAGASLPGAFALMLAWVNVGLIQLPAEAEALGGRFAVARNFGGFVMAVLMSLTVVLWQGGQTVSKETSQMVVSRFKPWLFPLGCVGLYALGFAVSPEKTVQALHVCGQIFRQLGLPMCFALVMMVLLNRFLSPSLVTKLLGQQAGVKGIVFSSLAGIFSMGPIYAWFPLFKTLLEKGASPFHLALFMGNRSVKPVLIPVMLTYFGWQLTCLFLWMNLVGAFSVAAFVSYVCPRFKLPIA